jgi:hypothetical protein
VDLNPISSYLYNELQVEMGLKMCSTQLN